MSPPFFLYREIRALDRSVEFWPGRRCEVTEDEKNRRGNQMSVVRFGAIANYLVPKECPLHCSPDMISRGRQNSADILLRGQEYLKAGAVMRARAAADME